MALAGNEVLDALANNANRMEIFDWLSSSPGLLDTLTVDELVKVGAYATLKYRDNKLAADGLLTLLSGRFSRLPVTIPDIPEHQAVGSISLITNICNEGPNFNLFSSYILLCLINPNISKVNAIFTGELSNRIWNRKHRTATNSEIYDRLNSRLLKLMETTHIRIDMGKLNMVVAPDADELANAIGDVVIKYEGFAWKNRTYLYADAIHARRPTLLATSSSLITSSKYADLILTVFPASSLSQARFICPTAGVNFLQSPIRSGNIARQKVVTVYGADRLENGVRQINAASWEKLDALFSACGELEWSLVGSLAPEKVVEKFPASFIEKFGNRISVKGFCDLNVEYADAFAFLALPRTFGGAGGAAKAVAQNVPLLVNQDYDSDIYNLFDDPAPLKSFDELLDTLQYWISNREAREVFLAKQRLDLQVQYDWDFKSALLYSYICKAKSLFRAGRAAQSIG